MNIRDVTDTLIDFLRARIDEDEQKWRSPSRRLKRIAADMLGDVKARRGIVDRISSSDRTPEDLLTLLGLATRYLDHPDYQLEWGSPDELPGFQPEWWSSSE